MSDDEFTHPERGLTPISIAAERLFYEIANKDRPDYLKAHPGRSGEILHIGMDRVLSHPILAASGKSTAEVKEAVLALYAKAERLCDSPIERNLLAALLTGCWAFNRSVVPLVHDDKDYNSPMPDGEVVIIPQFQLGRYRLDFAVRVVKDGGYHLICLECDGKDYHEDWERDERRDDYLRAFGVPVMRYSGSTLHQSPIATADTLIDAITEWRG